MKHIGQVIDDMGADMNPPATCSMCHRRTWTLTGGLGLPDDGICDHCLQHHYPAVWAIHQAMRRESRHDSLRQSKHARPKTKRRRRPLDRARRKRKRSRTTPRN